MAGRGCAEYIVDSPKVIKAYIRLRDYRADVLTEVPELKSNSMPQRSGRTDSRAPHGNYANSYYDPAYLNSGLDVDNSLSANTSQMFDTWSSSDSDSDYDYDMDIADNAEDSYDGLDQFGDYLEEDFATMTAMIVSAKARLISTH